MFKYLTFGKARTLKLRVSISLIFAFGSLGLSLSSISNASDNFTVTDQCSGKKSEVIQRKTSNSPVDKACSMHICDQTYQYCQNKFNELVKSKKFSNPTNAVSFFKSK